MSIRSFKSWLESAETGSKNFMVYKGKPFWIGCVNALDGEIEEIHDFETAQNYDFHHSHYFSPTAQKRMDSEESYIFWCNKPKIIDIPSWRSTMEPEVEKRLQKAIRNQITWNLGGE